MRHVGISGMCVIAPQVHHDDRGAFLEWFRGGGLADATGHELDVAQINFCTSRRGVVRGIHFGDVPPGQAKFITCFQGAILDVGVDVRVGSPTFGKWAAVRIDDQEYCGVYLAEGIGHAFMALTENAGVAYVSSQTYNPAREHDVHPLDPGIGIRWPDDIPPVLSPKDAAAPTLAAARDAGLLPRYADCLAL